MRKITRKAVLGELAAIAFSDFSKFAEIAEGENGEQVIILTDTKKLSADCRKALASMKAGTKGIEIKLYDKLRALEILCRIYGIYGGEDMAEKDALTELRGLFAERSDVFGPGIVSDT
ncbi:MAG: terminase small subunit [Oscillospiraceae bacterium]|nr:terminase small subunit [Oscillospiraceae bacterium]